MTTTVTAVAADDEQSVRGVVAAYEEAWNGHAMDAMAALFTEDADWINIVGWWWRGLPEVKRGYIWIFEKLFMDTPFHIDSCSVRLVTPDAAIAVVTWRKGAFVTPDGKHIPESKDRMSLVLVKRGARWLITSGHNTTIDAKAQNHNPIRTE